MIIRELSEGSFLNLDLVLDVAHFYVNLLHNVELLHGMHVEEDDCLDLFWIYLGGGAFDTRREAT